MKREIGAVAPQLKKLTHEVNAMRIFKTKPAVLVFALISVGQISIANAELNGEQIEEILAHRTNQYLADRGFRLSDSNWDFFAGAIRKAANDIAKVAPENQPARLEMASANIRLFIDVMSQETESIPGYGKRLGETTLAAAQISLCPLWPFC